MQECVKIKEFDKYIFTKIFCILTFKQAIIICSEIMNFNNRYANLLTVWTYTHLFRWLNLSS